MTTPRAQKTRLLSSLAMLALAVGGVWFYSVRQTNELFDIGVRAHLQCTVAGNYKPAATNGQLARDLGGEEHECSAGGKDFELVVLQRNGTPVSVALTRRGEQEFYPRSLSALHVGVRQEYAIAGFVSGSWLAYVVSALPEGENKDLAERLKPAIERHAEL